MRKITATILSLLAVTASLVPLSKGVTSAPLLAKAAEQTALPTDVATTEEYAAIATGNTVRLFDKKRGGFWQTYTHTQAIAQIAFDTKGILYLRDAHRNLYSLNASAFTEQEVATDTTVDCSAFFLKGDELYYASTADTNTLLYAYTAEAPSPLSFSGLYNEFYYHGDTLYALDNKGGLYTLDAASQQAALVTHFTSERNDLTVHGNTLYTTGESGLYRYELGGGTDTQLMEGAFTAVCSRNSGVYALRGAEVYTLTDGGVQVAAEEFILPSIEAIPTNDFQSSGFAVVTTLPQALLAEVDLANAGETLPLLRSKRTEPITALKLAETANYALLSYRESPASPYQSLVVAKNSYTQTGTETLYTSERTGYLSSAVGVYPYPHLGTTALANAKREEQVTLLGEVTGLDCEYYKVRYGEVVGYIPKAYASEYDGNPLTPPQETVGERESSKDSIWRMVYILLGTAAIGVLVDFLILRKKSEG